MSELAYRYGRAMFDIASEDQIKTLVYNDLTNSLKVLKDPQIARFFSAYEIDLKDKIMVLDEAFKTLSKPVLNLLKVLLKNHRITILEAVVNSFESLYYASENIKIAYITSPIDLLQSEKELLEQVLSQKYACQIDTRINIDQSLLSGLIIQIENDIYDNSLKSKFTALKETLLEGD